MRSGELCALKWSDIDFNKKKIHVHAQQLKKSNSKDYSYQESTKNEKGVSQGGRDIPLLNDTIKTLQFLQECQSLSNISSEYVFANEDGSWIKADTMYEKFLLRLCKKLGIKATNNHAIRKHYNSYILIKHDVPLNERAKVMGHSPEVNLRNYTRATSDYCELALKMIESQE